MFTESNHAVPAVAGARARRSAVAHRKTPVSHDAAVGRVQPLTRMGVWVLLVLAAANGLFLYVLPALADSDYAWSIKPPVNAAFIGAGFLAGTLATGLVLATATRWRTFSNLPPALWGGCPVRRGTS